LAFTAPPASVLISENKLIASENQSIANDNQSIASDDQSTTTPIPELIHHFTSLLYRVVPIVVWLVQLALLIALIYSTTNNDEEYEICPQSRAWDIKFAAAAVGLFYFTRMEVKASQLYAIAFRKPTNGRIIAGDSLSSFAPTFDFWYSQTFEYVTMFANLFFIFRSADSVQGVILRSVSFRFIQEMDDKYVRASLSHPIISRYIISMDAMSKDEPRSEKKMYKYGAYGFALLPPLLAIAFSIFLAICL